MFKIFDFDIKNVNIEALKSYELADEMLNISYFIGEETRSVDITIEVMDEKYVDFIAQRITQNPLLAENIMFNNIPDAFIEHLLLHDIKLFPLKREDISFSKKLSKDEEELVLGLLMSVLKDNKSFIFDLRGLPLENIQAFIMEQKSNNQENLKDVQVKKENNGEELIYMGLESNNIDEMFENFPQNPAFFDKKDFKYKVQDVYNLVEEEFPAVFITDSAFVIKNSDFYMVSEPRKHGFYLYPTVNYEIYVKSKGSLIKANKEIKELPKNIDSEIKFQEFNAAFAPKDLIYDYFLSFSYLVEEETFTESARFFNRLALFARDVVKTLNFVPEVNPLSDREFDIRYLPNYNNKHVLEVFESIKASAPINFGFSGKELFSVDKVEEILNDIVNYIVHKIFYLKGSKLKSNPIIEMFIKTKPIKSYRGDKNLAQSISNWFKFFDLNTNLNKLVLKFDSLNDLEYSINLDVLYEKEMMELKELFKVDDIKSKFLKNLSNQIQKASETLSSLNDFFCSFGEAKIIINAADLMNLIPVLYSEFAKLNIEILVPYEFKNIISPKISVKTRLKDGQEDSLKEILLNTGKTFNIEEIMEFSYEIALGDEKISPEEFMKLIKTSENLIKYKEKYILLKEEEIQKILKDLNKPIEKNLNSIEFIHSVFSSSMGNFEFDYEDAIKDAVANHLKVGDVEVSPNLKGELRAYQNTGFKWLYSNLLKGFGCCMADDMGLGKTVQALSLILKLKEEKKLTSPTLVVCPTTLIGNWKKECEKFTPTLKTSIYHGLERELDLKADIIITTYALLRIDSEKLKKNKWGMIIIDEAQNIKNHSTNQTLAVKSMSANYKIAMTGTPIENKLTELWSIFDFLNKGYLGTIGEFQHKYSLPIEKFKDEKVAEKLRTVSSPFILRRLKSDKSIISDLPEKEMLDEYCYLTPEQAALYEKTLQSTMKDIKNSDNITRRGNILKLITSLKQICNHPANYLKNHDFSEEISGKTQKTLSILDKIIKNGEKALVFSQYKEMGSILERIFTKKFGCKVNFFHGSLSVKEREKLINEFQNDDDVKIMILSLKAGGTGLNLTSATNVIHYDLWWNPAIEQQATDRTYRIGQTKNVSVHRLITLNTFEEKIDDMIKSKQQIADISLWTGERMIGDLSDNEILEIFSLR